MTALLVDSHFHRHPIYRHISIVISREMFTQAPRSSALSNPG
jgi:hypothetical protein